jgi:hypothetical protein
MSNQYLQLYQQWSDKTPWVTRLSMVSIVVIYILSWVFSFDTVLGNVPYFTIFNYEIYRILFSPFVGNSLFQVILIAMFFPAMGSKMEWSLGSTGFIVLIGTCSLLTNILFDIVCILLSLLGTPEAIFSQCFGFWLIIFSLITIESMLTPDAPRRMMFIPVDIPSKYFPLALYVLFSLFSGPQLGYAISIAIGYLYSIGKLDRLKPSSSYLDSMEINGMLHSVSRQQGWVLTGLAQGNDAWIPVNQSEAQEENQPQQSTSTSGGSYGTNRGDENTANTKQKPVDHVRYYIKYKSII